MNYSLVANSQFRPYELSELLPIYQANQQAQQQAEDAFTQLSVKAGQWEKLANSAKDVVTYNRYKSYANDLNSQIDDLMQNGININSRKALMNLRARYASQIIPIEEAYNKREQQANEIWKMYAQDPTLIMEYNPNDKSLEDYINNPSLRPHLYSGKLLTAQVAGQAQALANRITSLQKSGKLDKYYDEITKTYGLTPKDVNDFLNGKVNNNILSTIIKNTLDSSGISKWANENVLKQSQGFMNQGIYSGIGKSDIALQRDLDMMTPMEQAQYQGQLLNNKTAELNNQIAMLQLQQLLNPQSDTPSLIHDEGEFVSGTDTYRSFNDLKNNLYIHKGTGGLNTEYAGKKFINPMKVYEEYEKIANTSSYGVSTGTSSSGTVLTYGNKVNINAFDKLRKKYGITKILTKDQYERLKELGYSSNSTRKDFYKGNFDNNLNNIAKLYRPTSTSMAKYDFVNDRILNNLNSNIDNMGTRVYEYKNGKAGKAVTNINDVLNYDKNGKIQNKIVNISYSALQPDKLLITLNDKNKKFFIDPYEFSADAGELLKQAKANFKSLKTNKEKSELQDYVTDALRMMFMNYQKVRTDTDANI